MHRRCPEEGGRGDSRHMAGGAREDGGRDWSDGPGSWARREPPERAGPPRRTPASRAGGGYVSAAPSYQCVVVCGAAPGRADPHSLGSLSGTGKVTTQDSRPPPPGRVSPAVLPSVGSRPSTAATRGRVG